ncbi:DUF6695 family protein [Winogradskyella immobilis]|uniref:Uncharacterized protein n=1 Tax=Winogradskyella immobilis TaxID=2816852 RepID=A0ABS8EJV4_9FLAO|nr:DUF6695 family protein [Winogradskyella immobilis]MCC1483236.1 hypothetical protein [Winogradskyella immobilis]MCG0015330.1 hypothetical protein [Winogradskyella immobilis]
MLQNDAFILTLGYPETVVMVAEEWYSKFLRVIGIGKKNYVRAGHAALVLIDKSTGVLEYHDFGRYVTEAPYGRVRGFTTDRELDFPLKAEIKNDTIVNLESILVFLATNPKLTHGDGVLVASVCNAVNYKMARQHIDGLQEQGFITYAAFADNACNCARFVTDTIIAGTTDETLRKRLIKYKWFTPSTGGNAVKADTENFVYEVSEKGEITEFKSTIVKENLRLFLDRLKDHQPNFIGSLEPKHNAEKHENAQWLSGIGSGAWFELYDINKKEEYRFRRISPYGDVDVDGVFKVDASDFDSSKAYKFVYYSNCLFFHIEQNNTTYKFDFLRDYESNQFKEKGALNLKEGI